MTEREKSEREEENEGEGKKEGKKGKEKEKEEMKEKEGGRKTENGRENEKSEREAAREILLSTEGHTFLDQDLIRSGMKVKSGAGEREIDELLGTVREDAEFLAKHNLMDYSLLMFSSPYRTDFTKLAI